MKAPASLEGIAAARETPIWKWVMAREKFLEWFRKSKHYQFDEQVPSISCRSACDWFLSLDREPTKKQWLEICDQWGKWTEERRKKYLAGQQAKK